MAKRQIEFDDTIPKFVVWAVGIAFTVYFAANALYIENHELAYEKEDFNRKIIMAESARYMELIQYYADKGELTEAEQMRLSNVNYMHCRLSKELAEQDPIMCVYQ